MTENRQIKIRQENLDKPFPNFQQPKICGYFSIDKNREYLPDCSNLKYFCDPPTNNHRVNFDLNKGIEHCVKKPDDLDERLDHLLNFISRNLQNLVCTEEKMLKVDFVCYRGLLTHMMDSIYHHEEWSVLVTNWNGTFYLSEIKNQPSYNISKAKMDTFTSWGYKFEQYMFSDSIGNKPDVSKPLYESEEFCIVFSTKLNSKSILYGAEIDGVISKEELNEPILSWDGVEFVEVKTSKEISHPKQEYNLKRHKYIKWWAQSFLVGIKKLYCGFRNDNGIVKHVQEFLVRDLARNSVRYFAERGTSHIPLDQSYQILLIECEWDANEAMNLCDQFLSIIKENIPSSREPSKTWKITWSYKNGDYFLTITSSSDYILPKWYSDLVLSHVRNIL